MAAHNLAQLHSERGDADDVLVWAARARARLEQLSAGEDLRQLDAPYPEVVVSDGGRVRVGAAEVRMVENRVTLEKAGERIDLIRAATAAIWQSGLAIYGIDVAPELLDALGIAR